MVSNSILAMAASDPAAVIASPEETYQNPKAAIASSEPSDQNPTVEINAASSKARKPAWNVPRGKEVAEPVEPVMGAAAWPSLSRSSPKSSTTPTSSSDSLKSLSEGSSASASVIQNLTPSPDTVLVSTPVQAKPNPNPNPKPNTNTNLNPNHTRHTNNPNNRSSKWNNHRRNNNNNYHHNNNNNNHNHNQNNNGGYRGREKGGSSWNNNNNSNNNNMWGNGNNNGNGSNNSLHQRPQHFIRANPVVNPPPVPAVSFGFAAAPVAAPFYAPLGFPEYQYSVIGHMPLIAAGPQFVPQMVPPVILTSAEIDRRNAIVKQIEYYFSTENLCKDVYLRKNMNEQGWVPISLIAGFNRVKQLTTDMQYILDVIKTSTVLEVQGDKIRARNNWMNWIFTDRMQGLNISAPLTTGRNK